ncbi:MAG: hypothetical protein WA324_27815 [Bryobacteraceae bacterium]
MATTIQLKAFTAKASPVPADIVYLGDSANSFNEVQSTIAEVIGAYPALVSIGGLTTAANEIIYTTASNTYATAPITAFGLSVLALAAGVTVPTAGDFATWDANKNLSANNINVGYATTVTSATPIVLVVGSAFAQYLTGSTAQTVTMPVTSTLASVAAGIAQSFQVVNLSSANTTVNSSGGNLIVTLLPNTQATLTCILNTGTTAASWSVIYASESGEVSSGQGTANQVLVNGTSGSQITGNLIFTLPQSIDTTSDVTFDSLAFSNTAKGIVGTATNDAAGAGYVGRAISSVIPAASAVALTTATATNITTLALAAGDYDVWANMCFLPANTTSVTSTLGWISLTSATVPDASLTGGTNYGSTPIVSIGGQIGVYPPSFRVSLAAPATLYLSSFSQFSISTMGVCGGLYARIRR